MLPYRYINNDRSSRPVSRRSYEALLKTALPTYDALYTWCRSLGGERHGWYPQTVLKEMSQWVGGASRRSARNDPS